MKKILTTLKNNIKNIPGWKTNRKIVVFVSDDWGDQRIKSKVDYQQLIKEGFGVDNRLHTSYDGIANQSDLETLFNVLSSTIDKYGNYCVFSPFCIMANPDFELIKKNNYERYYFKTFTETIEKDNKASLNTWLKGINEGLFVPALHGRDHLNVPLWMRLLQKNNTKALNAFNMNYAFIASNDLPVPLTWAHYFDNEEDLKVLKNSLQEGISLFEKTFGTPPKVFNPPNGIFHEKFYSVLNHNFLNTILTHHFRIEPKESGKLTKRYQKMGRIKKGINHIITNCAFEPIKGNSSLINNTISQIEAAFRWNKPALINTHRINYVSIKSKKTRDHNLKQLNELLNQIKHNWPDVEFMSADKLSEIMKNKKHG